MLKEVLVLSLAVLTAPSIAGSDKLELANQANWTLGDDSWNYWWSYSGVSGPGYWGLLNLDWFVCDKGRRQSPINIETSSLVYDPNLTPLRADNNLISGLLYNDGHAIVFNASIVPPRPTNTEPSQTPRTKQPISDEPATRKQSLDGSFRLLKRSLATDSDDGDLFDGEPVSPALAFLELPSKLHSSQSNILGADFKASPLSDQQMGTDRPAANGNEPSGESAEQVQPGAADQQDHGQLEADSQDGQANQPAQAYVHFTGAGLAYSFRFELLYLRFGSDNSRSGSEHQIESQSYPAEVQLIAYNEQLYKSFAEASTKPNGLVAISILVDVIRATETQNQAKSSLAIANENNSMEQLSILLHRIGDLRNRGHSKPLLDFNLSALLPERSHFVTYEGSLTTPGCHESVTWLLLNKPLYMTQSSLDSLRSISADEPSSAPSGTLIAGNIRPVQPVNNRPIRTNIRPTRNNNQHPDTCKQLRTRYDYKKNR